MRRQNETEQSRLRVPEESADPQWQYANDLWSWARHQGAALRRGDFGALDWENLIEAVKDHVHHQERWWTFSCAKVLERMLRTLHSLDGFPRRKAYLKIWRLQSHMKSCVDKNPGMRGKLHELLDQAWGSARAEAIRKLSTDKRWRHPLDYPEWLERDHRMRDLEALIPRECPWSLIAVAGYDPWNADEDTDTDDDLLPAEAARLLGLEHEGDEDYSEDEQTGESSRAPAL